MAVHSHQIFSKVEATLNNEWIRSSGESITDILNKIDKSSGGNVEIHFKGGNHIISGSFDEIASVHSLFFDRDKEDQQSLEIKTPLVPNSNTDIIASSDLAEYSACDELVETLCHQMKLNNLNETDLSNVKSSKHNDIHGNGSDVCSRPDVVESVVDILSSDDEIIKEVDPDIWDFIREKKPNELKEFTEIHGISYVSEWDPEEEFYKIHLKINRRSNNEKINVQSQLEEAGKQFSKFFHEISDVCEIDKVRGKFSSEDVAIQYIKTKFPSIYLKLNPENIFFIGIQDEVRKAKKQFNSIIAKKAKAARERSKKMPSEDISRRHLKSFQYGQNDSISDDPSASFCVVNSSFSTDDDSSLKTENSGCSSNSK